MRRRRAVATQCRRVGRGRTRPASSRASARGSTLARRAEANIAYDLRSLFNAPRVLLDGATGYRLIAAGVDPVDAAITAPKKLAEMHQADADAGADAITAATFAVTSPRVLREAVRLAGRFDRPVIASLGPVDLEGLTARGAACMDAGADLLALETFGSVTALVQAIERLASWPLIACISPRAEVRARAQPLVEAGAAGVGVNCGDGTGGILAAAIEWVGCGVPVVFRPSAGLPVQGVYPMAADEFAELAQAAWAAGVFAVGGCCGVGPEHIAAAHRVRSSP